MKLRAVRVSDVKGFSAPGKAVEGITDGLNVMAAANEFGKSSLFEALRAALFETYSYKNERTKALRPYQSGGAPMVEVDLEMPSGLFRIRKRFLSRASASVIDVQRGQAVAAADEVQDWIVELLGAAKPDDGPTGLLWVEQGQSLKQPKAGGHAGELLAGLLEREVSTVTGGAKLREVLEEAKWQLAQLLTPNTKKPTGTYKTLLKEQNDLTAEVARLEARLDDVEQMRQDLNSLEHTLAELENPKRQSELQQELQLANDRYQEARHVLIRVEDLKKQAAVTERRLEEQTAALEQLQTAQSRTRHLMEQAKELRGKLSECESVLKAKTKTRDAALEAEQAQQNVCETARRAFETAQQAARAITAQKEFESAKAKVTTAEAIHQEWTAAAKERDQNPIKSSDVQKIEDLQRAAELADARIKDGQTTVSVTYEDDTSHRIRIGKKVVEDQEVHVVDGRLELSIESVGQVVIEAGRG
ncbi:MAG: AAA family ATPase, partial [Alphaproteobacteria bacterium]|nr:AAA family ATPase [Alphaproteobacteria bacterium]